MPPKFVPPPVPSFSAPPAPSFSAPPVPVPVPPPSQEPQPNKEALEQPHQPKPEESDAAADADADAADDDCQVGVGITFKRDRETGMFLVKRIVSGIEANKCVHVGQVLVEVEGKKITGRSFNTLSRYLLGKPGTFVQLGFVADATADLSSIQYLRLERVSAKSAHEDTTNTKNDANGNVDTNGNNNIDNNNGNASDNITSSHQSEEEQEEEINVETMNLSSDNNQPTTTKVRRRVYAPSQPKKVSFRDEHTGYLEAGPGPSTDTSPSLFPTQVLQRLSTQTGDSVMLPSSAQTPSKTYYVPPPQYSAPVVPKSSRELKGDEVDTSTVLPSSSATAAASAIPVPTARTNKSKQKNDEDVVAASIAAANAASGPDNNDKKCNNQQQEDENDDYSGDEWDKAQKMFEKEHVIVSGEGKHAVRKFNHTYAKMLRKVTEGGKDKVQKTRKFDFDEIIPGLFQGRLPRHKRDLQILKDIGVGAIVSLTESWEMKLPLTSLSMSDIKSEPFNFHHLYLPTPDFSCPSSAAMRSAVEFIEEHIKSTVVFVHCNAGKSRSAAVCTCYLMKENSWTAQKAFDYVRSMRPISSLGPWFSSFWVVLQKYEVYLKKANSPNSDDESDEEVEEDGDGKMPQSAAAAAAAQQTKKSTKTSLDKKAQKLAGDVGKSIVSFLGGGKKKKDRS